MSKATEYTKSILDVFLNTLPIQWNNNEPFLVHHQINVFNVRSLQQGLLDILKSSLKDSAIQDLEQYGRSGSIQTSGVGLADDFNTFVNLGLLIGERVVLWDTVILGTVFPTNGKISVFELSAIAIDFVLLQDAIENGHVVMLPHPASWLERCQRYYQAIYEIDEITPTFQGYLHSRALLDEGFEIHPYTMNQASKISGKKNDIKSAINLIEKDNQGLEKKELAADDLIFDAQFCYLKDIETRQLSNFLHESREWKRELDKKLRIPDYVCTSDDIRAHIDELKSQLLVDIDKQNKRIHSYRLGVKEHGINVASGVSGIVSGTIGMAVSNQEGASLLGACGAGIGVFGAGVAAYNAFLALSKVIKNPDKNIVTLYQGFTIISDMAEANKQLSRIQKTSSFR